MLKRVWKEEKRLKEKQACSHSKCDLCSKLDAEYERLRGNNTREAILIRTHLKRAREEHEARHLADRIVLDDAGQLAFSDPHAMWCIAVDAATQRNFELPKFQFRTPKLFAGRPFWGFKLMAAYAYGFGFMPFLIHDSQTYGANLTWTVLWLALCRMRDHHGFWPDTLHIQLDNTTGENKNEYMIAMCAWLVASGKVKHVRVFFLKVGHTHIVIDHVFGVVTVGLRRQELMTPADLMANIDASLLVNPVYMSHPVEWLHCLFDIKGWCTSQMGLHTLERVFKGEVCDELGPYVGMYDLHFRSDREALCRMQYREDQAFHLWPENSPGVLTIKQLPTSPPGLAEIKPFNQWGTIGTKTFLNTIAMVSRFSRSIPGHVEEAGLLRLWRGCQEDVPTIIALLKPEFKIEFRHFNSLDVPRLRAPSEQLSADQMTQQENTGDLGYDDYCQRFLGGMRAEPLMFDPVVSSEQSQAQYKRRKDAVVEQARTFRGPSTVQASLVFPGEFIFAETVAGGGATLFQVQTLARLMTPRTEGLQLNCVAFDHTPNPKVSGFFGTFQKSKETSQSDGKQHLVQRIVTRQQILVFNVEYKSKLRTVSLESIRCLSRISPIAYGMPERKHIPKTFLDDSSDDEEDGDSDSSADVPKKSKPVAKPPKPKAPQEKSSSKRKAPEAEKAPRQQPQRSA